MKALPIHSVRYHEIFAIAIFFYLIFFFIYIKYKIYSNNVCFIFFVIHFFPISYQGYTSDSTQPIKRISFLY